MKVLNFEISNDQAKDAFRLAVQSAASITITYLVVQKFEITDIFVALLSAVLVVEPTIADTINQARNRITATFVGSVIAFFLVAILPWGLGTIISLAVTMFIINGIAGFKPSWRYGTVAAVAISLGSNDNAFDTSWNRLLAIGIGLSIGIIISLIIFPDKAENRAKRHIRKALRAAAARFEIALNNTRKKDNNDFTDAASKFHKNINAAQKTANAIKFTNKSIILRRIENTRKLYNSILIIHRVAQSSKEDITSGDSGIEKDSQIVREKASQILKALADNKEIDEKDLKIFSELVEEAKEHIVLIPDNKSINMLRQTLVFGLTEVRESIEALVKNYNN